MTSRASTRLRLTPPHPVQEKGGIDPFLCEILYTSSERNESQDHEVEPFSLPHVSMGRGINHCDTFPTSDR